MYCFLCSAECSTFCHFVISLCYTFLDLSHLLFVVCLTQAFSPQVQSWCKSFAIHPVAPLKSGPLFMLFSIQMMSRPLLVHSCYEFQPPLVSNFSTGTIFHFKVNICIFQYIFNFWCLLAFIKRLWEVHYEVTYMLYCIDFMDSCKQHFYGRAWPINRQLSQLGRL